MNCSHVTHRNAANRWHQTGLPSTRKGALSAEYRCGRGIESLHTEGFHRVDFVAEPAGPKGGVDP